MQFFARWPALAILAPLTGCMIHPEHGNPSGASVRIGNEIATLIVTSEPYFPSLHKSAYGEKNFVDLFLVPADGRSKSHKLRIASGMAPSSFGPRDLLLGEDGRYLWFYANGLGAYDSTNARLITSDLLRRANPSLKNLPGVDNSNNPLIAPEARRPISTNDDLWDGDPRRMSVAARLQVRTPDYKRVLEVDPATLQASETQTTRPPQAKSPLQFGTSPTGMVTASMPGAWTVETEIARANLEQTLAGDGFTALRGGRVKKDGVISEPLLVIVRHEKGEVRTTSLWQ